MNLLPVALLSILPAALAQDPSVNQIMARVAENQARAQDLRAFIVPTESWPAKRNWSTW